VATAISAKQSATSLQHKPLTGKGSEPNHLGEGHLGDLDLAYCLLLIVAFAAES
jgi:hypothetical protein